jgi:hypothetical protein
MLLCPKRHHTNESECATSASTECLIWLVVEAQRAEVRSGDHQGISNLSHFHISFTSPSPSLTHSQSSKAPPDPAHAVTSYPCRAVCCQSTHILATVGVSGTVTSRTRAIQKKGVTPSTRTQQETADLRAKAGWIGWGFSQSGGVRRRVLGPGPRQPT